MYKIKNKLIVSNNKNKNKVSENKASNSSFGE